MTLYAFSFYTTTLFFFMLVTRLLDFTPVEYQQLELMKENQQTLLEIKQIAIQIYESKS